MHIYCGLIWAQESKIIISLFYMLYSYGKSPTEVCFIHVILLLICVTQMHIHGYTIYCCKLITLLLP